MRSPLAWRGTVRTASGWMVQKGYPVVGNFMANQDALQAFFTAQLPAVPAAGTRRVLSKALGRAGKYSWMAGGNTAANAARFLNFSETTRRSNAENTLGINCWEAVLHWTYEAELLTKTQCRRLYLNHPHNPFNPADVPWALRRIFGSHPVRRATAASAGLANTPQVGDVLMWGRLPGAGGLNAISHVALYVGQVPGGGIPGGIAAGAPGDIVNGAHYLIHNLALLTPITGYLMGGCSYLASIPQVTAAMGVGNGWACAPFWVAGSPTHEFYTAL